MQRFEEGTRLVRICQSKLEEVEQKIEKLEKNLGGELTVKPLKLNNDNTET
jgi:exonuclease VII small subunit